MLIKSYLDNLHYSSNASLISGSVGTINNRNVVETELLNGVTIMTPYSDSVNVNCLSGSAGVFNGAAVSPTELHNSVATFAGSSHNDTNTNWLAGDNHVIRNNIGLVPAELNNGYYISTVESVSEYDQTAHWISANNGGAISAMGVIPIQQHNACPITNAGLVSGYNENIYGIRNEVGIATAELNQGHNITTAETISVEHIDVQNAKTISEARIEIALLIAVLSLTLRVSFDSVTLSNTITKIVRWIGKRKALLLGITVLALTVFSQAGNLCTQTKAPTIELKTDIRISDNNFYFFTNNNINIGK